MIINGFKQEKCTLYYRDENNTWIPFAKLDNCNDAYSGFTIPNGKQKRCNIATFLAEQALPDAVQLVIKAQEDAINTGAAISGGATLIAFLATIIAPLTGGTTLFVLDAIAGMSTYASGASAVVSAIGSADLSQLNVEINNQYWAEVRKKLYCAIPSNGVITAPVLYALGKEIEKIPDKPNANPVLSGIIAGINPEVMAYYFQLGSLTESDLSSCELSGCQACQLEIYPNNGTLEYSSATNIWRIVSTNTPNAGTSYRTTLQLPLETQTCVVRAFRVISGTVENVRWSTQARVNFMAGIFSDSEYASGSYNDIIGQYFNSIEISSTTPFEVHLELGEEPLPNEQKFLYLDPPAVTNRRFINPIRIDPDAFIFGILSGVEPQPDSEGWHHYYLENETDCALLDVIPMEANVTPPDYGWSPQMVNVWQTVGQEPLLLPNFPTSADNNPISFYHVALKGKYLLKIRVKSCEVNTPVVQLKAQPFNSTLTLQKLTDYRWEFTCSGHAGSGYAEPQLYHPQIYLEPTTQGDSFITPTMTSGTAGSPNNVDYYPVGGPGMGGCGLSVQAGIAVLYAGWCNRPFCGSVASWSGIFEFSYKVNIIVA
jgi:hypothetical protein